MVRSIPKILNDEYDFIFSLGQACAGTQILRMSKLQFQSYPLDWLYGGDIVTRTDLLVNDFKNFFDKEDLECIGQRVNPRPCDIYKNKSNGLVFNHDFELNGSFEENYPEIREKYDRRIKRLYENIEKSSKVLIFFLQTPSTKTKNLSDLKKQILECYDKIHQKWNDKEICLLYLLNRKPFFFKEKLENIDDNVVLAQFKYKSKDKNAEPHVVNSLLLVKFLKNIKLSKKVIEKQEKRRIKFV